MGKFRLKVVDHVNQSRFFIRGTAVNCSRASRKAVMKVSSTVARAGKK